MSRHPYTYAADFIRALGPVNSSGVVLSRADASQIRKGIAAAIGISDFELANILSEAEQKKTDGDVTEQANKVLQAIFARNG